MGKSIVLTPLYISVAWSLMVGYQLFTQTAVNSVVENINMIWPSMGEWLLLRVDTLVFVHAFAWIWVLSSLIPSVLVGEERGVLVLFVVCLTLTLTAVWFIDILALIVGSDFQQRILELSVWFKNPWLALLYISAPYVLMLCFDLFGKRKRKRKEKLEEIVTETAVAETVALEE